MHEAGHAVAGWLVGCPPWAVQVGGWAKRHPANPGIHWGGWQAGGKTWLRPRPWRWAALGVLAAGSVNEGLGALGLVAVVATHGLARNVGVAEALGWAWLAANGALGLCDAVTNLRPSDWRWHDGTRLRRRSVRPGRSVHST